jgi:hypothetical protein
VNQSQEMCAFCFIPTGATQSSWHQQYNHSVQEDLWIPCTLWLFNIAMVEMAHLYMMFVSDDDDDSPIINRDLRILMWI